EQSCVLPIAVRERMRYADWGGHERAHAQTEPLVADEEVDLTVEDVEGVDVIVVAVRVRAFEAGVDLELDQRQLLPADLDRRDPVVRFEPLSLSRLQEDSLGRRLAAPRWSVDAVEAALLAAIACSQVVREAAVRRVEVEEDRGG